MWHPAQTFIKNNGKNTVKAFSLNLYYVLHSYSNLFTQLLQKYDIRVLINRTEFTKNYWFRKQVFVHMVQNQILRCLVWQPQSLFYINWLDIEIFSLPSLTRKKTCFEKAKFLVEQSTFWRLEETQHPFRISAPRYFLHDSYFWQEPTSTVYREKIPLGFALGVTESGKKTRKDS